MLATGDGICDALIAVLLPLPAAAPADLGFPPDRRRGCGSQLYTGLVNLIGFSEESSFGLVSIKKNAAQLRFL
jgi:hypothetical protein